MGLRFWLSALLTVSGGAAYGLNRKMEESGC